MPRQFYQPAAPQPPLSLPIGLREPDTILPAQMERRMRLPREPERRLFVAILETACQDLGLRCHKQGPRPRADGPLAGAARLWVLGADAPLHFDFVCDVLGLDASAVRARLLSSGGNG